MQLIKKIINCSYDSSIEDTNATGTGVSQNQEDTGYLAVSLIDPTADDNTTSAPVPKVRLATNLQAVYGAIATINTATGRCGVITQGIVPFKAQTSYTGTATRESALSAAEVGKGVMGAPNGKVQRAGVTLTGDPPTAANYTSEAGKGRGLTIGKDRQGTSNDILWVDLSNNVNAV